jgi:hypothetical protein
VSSNLAPGDTNLQEDVFLRDRQLGTTVRLSVSNGGVEGNDASGQSRMSTNGRFVVFFSAASTLVPGDSNGAGDIYLRDLQSGAIERVSVATGGAQADQGSISSWVSSDGRFVSFMSAEGSRCDLFESGMRQLRRGRRRHRH